MMLRFDADVRLAAFAMVAIVAITASVAYSHVLTSIAAPPAQRAAAVANTKGLPIELVDADGWVTTIDRPPNRIVSVAIATDEMLLNLISESRIAALSAFVENSGMSNVSVEAKRVAGRVRGDAEAILALEPDLVLATEFLAVEVVEILRGCRVPVHRLRRNESLADILHDFSVLGIALGVEKESTVKRREFDRCLADLDSRVGMKSNRQSVLLLSAGGFTAGAGTLWNEIAKRAGATNHAASLGVRGYGTLSVEQALADPPDWIVTASDSTNDFHTPEWLKNDAGWSRVQTVRENRIIVLPSRLLSTASQYAVECCALLERQLGSKTAKPSN